MSTSENIAGIDARKTKKVLIAELEALRCQVAELDQSSRDRESQFFGLAMNLPGVVYQRSLHPDGTTTFPFVSSGVREVYGYTHLIPTHQGRGAEHLLSQLLVSKDDVIPGNMYFTTTRFHQEYAGGIFEDVIIDEAHDPKSDYPFK